MAIILYGKTKCPLCLGLILADDRVVTTSAFLFDQQSPLWPYSDAAMHQDCFLTWDMRVDFIASFNSHSMQYQRGLLVMLNDGSIQEHQPQ